MPGCAHSSLSLFSGIIDIASPTARGAKWSPYKVRPSNTCIPDRCFAAWLNDDPLRGGPHLGHSPTVWIIVRCAGCSPDYIF
eukprot:8133913-Heterocapsa_arctica.AAC.1